MEDENCRAYVQTAICRQGLRSPKKPLSPFNLCCPSDTAPEIPLVGAQFKPTHIWLLLQGSLLILSSKLILFLLWENLRRLSGEYRKFQKLLHSLENLIKLSFLHGNNAIIGLPQWLNGKKKKKKICLQCRRHREYTCDPWVGKIPWRRAWKPTLVSLPGESPWAEKAGRLKSIWLQRV